MFIAIEYKNESSSVRSEIRVALLTELGITRAEDAIDISSLTGLAPLCYPSVEFSHV
jgi:hypothetical protein